MMEKKKKKLKNNSFDYNDLKDCHLSIQLSLDGFSFCILDIDTNEIFLIKHFSFKNKSPNPEKHLENVAQLFETEELLQQKYGSVNITHVNNLSTLVPKALFDSDSLKQYIKYNSKIYKNDYIVFDPIENHDIINVYIPFVNINNFFLDKFGGFEYKHAATILVDNLLNTYKFSERPHVFVHVLETELEIVVIARNKLLLYNSFSYETKEDFMYYILFIAEQLQLNPEKFELILSGFIDKESDKYKMAYTYIRNVSLLENRFQCSFDTSISEVTKRQHFTLLNQY